MLISLICIIQTKNLSKVGLYYLPYDSDKIYVCSINTCVWWFKLFGKTSFTQLNMIISCSLVSSWSACSSFCNCLFSLIYQRDLKDIMIRNSNFNFLLHHIKIIFANFTLHLKLYWNLTISFYHIPRKHWKVFIK